MTCCDSARFFSRLGIQKWRRTADSSCGLALDGLLSNAAAAAARVAPRSIIQRPANTTHKKYWGGFAHPRGYGLGYGALREDRGPVTLSTGLAHRRIPHRKGARVMLDLLDGVQLGPRHQDAVVAGGGEEDPLGPGVYQGHGTHGARLARQVHVVAGAQVRPHGLLRLGVVAVRAVPHRADGRRLVRDVLLEEVAVHDGPGAAALRPRRQVHDVHRGVAERVVVARVAGDAHQQVPGGVHDDGGHGRDAAAPTPAQRQRGGLVRAPHPAPVPLQLRRGEHGARDEPLQLGVLVEVARPVPAGRVELRPGPRRGAGHRGLHGLGAEALRVQAGRHQRLQAGRGGGEVVGRGQQHFEAWRGRVGGGGAAPDSLQVLQLGDGVDVVEGADDPRRLLGVVDHGHGSPERPQQAHWGHLWVVMIDQLLGDVQKFYAFDTVLKSTTGNTLLEWGGRTMRPVTIEDIITSQRMGVL
ncbi:putative protein phosphatase 2C 65 [Frankliniella fusca]|uniref:Uncharacterized protein n=1 Tax=Frankliniella fusca TaxID=407009 RepID=A0AAE1HUK8_9NEOP|nr:putative protein phosphatase 2C 65 [Frankliniella fusca]